MFNFKLDHHPARQTVNGKSIPIITDIKSIRVEGEDGRFYLAGYVNVKNQNVSLINQYPEVFIDELNQFIEKSFGDSGVVNKASILQTEPSQYDDWDEG